jgi:hypothetical protein
MQAKLICNWSLGALLAACSFCLSAAPPDSSNIQYLRPADLSNPPSMMPGSAHGHVRQRLEYGQGYRYGHRVNGPLGDITIWSASPNQPHDTRIMRPNTVQRPRTTTVTGPQLQYKQDYGKSSKPGYGD